MLSFLFHFQRERSQRTSRKQNEQEAGTRAHFVFVRPVSLRCCERFIQVAYQRSALESRVKAKFPGNYDSYCRSLR